MIVVLKHLRNEPSFHESSQRVGSKFGAHQSAHPGLRLSIHLSPVLVLTAGPEQGIPTVEMESGDDEPEDLRPQCVEWLADKVRASLGCDAPSIRALFDENPQAIDDFLQGAPTGNFLTQRFYQPAQHDAPIALFSDPAVTPRTHQTIIHVHPDAGTGRSEALLVFVDESAPRSFRCLRQGARV